MTKIAFVGDCQKHDLVLAIAHLLHAYKEGSRVSIRSDSQRQYRYFNGEASGIHIRSFADEPASESDIELIDWHSAELPQDNTDKLYVVTSYEKASLETAAQILHSRSASGIIAIESECSITPKYVKTHLTFDGRTMSYFDSSRRRLDWVFDGRITLRKLENDFTETVERILEDLLNISDKEMKKLWSFVQKRGA